MRIRTIKPDFWLHEGLAQLSAMHRLLFIGLWQLADREGRLEDRPQRIAAAIFPYSPDVDVHVLLAELDAAGFVHRYGEGLLAIPGFAEHQRPHPKEPKSAFPPPPDRGSKRRAPPPETMVYFLQDDRTKYIKIGASRDVPNRVSMLGTGNPGGGFTLLGFGPGGFALERLLHLQLAEHREVGEWFRPTPEVLKAVIDHGRVEPSPEDRSSVPSTPVGREGKGREGKGREGVSQQDVLPAPAVDPAAEIWMPEAIDPPDKFADSGAFEEWFQFKRGEAGFIREKRASSVARGRWWTEVHVALNGDPTPLEVAAAAFAADPYWETRTPPMPFRGFMSEWRKFVPQLKGAA